MFLGNNLFSIDQKNDSLYDYFDLTIQKAWQLSNICPDSSMLITQQALANPNIENYQLEKAELLRIKGLIYFYKVDFVNSLDYFIQSKELFIKLDNKSGIAASLNSISLIYREQGFMQKSLEMDLEILKMQLEIGDTIEIAGSLNNVAVSYQDLKDFKLALLYFQKAVQYISQSNNKKNLDLYYNNIGNIYMLEDKLDSALYFFKKSYKISKKSNDKQMICNSLAYFGEYYSKKKDFKKSVSYYEKSIKIAHEIGIVYEISDVAEKLHVAYSKIGNYENAYKTLLIAKTLADSANNSETLKKLTEIEASIKFKKENDLKKLIQEKKDIQNRLELNREKQYRNIALIVGSTFIILTIVFFINSRRKTIYNRKLIEQKTEILSQKEEIETQRDNIEDLNKTKDKFFTIIAHDLRNPISGIYKLTDTINIDFESFTKSELKTYISLVHNSTQQAHSLLENLLHWAMMQTSSIKTTPSKFNLNDVIKQNIELLNNNAHQKNLTIVYDSNEENIVFADKEMIATTIRNIYTNAIKFSNNNGTITFSTSIDNNFCKLSISDNGIGISAEDQKLLFNIRNNTKKIGDSKEKGTGLGLILCKEFVEYNNGEIGITSELGNGTTFFFTVPLLKES